MKNKLIKITVILLVLTFIPVFGTAAESYDDVFPIEMYHDVQISADEIFDENNVSIAEVGGNNKYETVIEQNVSGDKITLYGFLACDTKIVSFGYGYAFDGNAVMDSEKYVGPDHELLQTIFSNYTEAGGEVTRFRIDVPVYDGENEVYALVMLEDGNIYEIWRVLYTGTNGNTPEYSIDQDIAVSVTAEGTNIKNKQYTVPAHIMDDCFYLEMGDVTASIEKQYGAEYAIIEIFVNGEEADHDDMYDNIPRSDIYVSSCYNDGDVVSVTYEKVAQATVDTNYAGGEKIKVRAVHGATASLDKRPMRKDMILVDFNTRPDGKGDSCIVDGFITFPSDRSVDLNDFTIYAIWKELSVPGDVNGDGLANNKDIVTLFKLVSGESVSYDEFAVDVNNDGEENNKDVVVLFKYVSGGDVKAYYYGYTLKQSIAGFSFDLPKGFIEAASDDESLMLIGICGDLIVAEVSSFPSDKTLANTPDSEFRQLLESSAGLKIGSINRTTINGVYAVRIPFTVDDISVHGENVFIVKGSSLLSFMYITDTELYTSDLNNTILSIK